jgi:hypothetical protein
MVVARIHGSSRATRSRGKLKRLKEGGQRDVMSLCFTRKGFAVFEKHVRSLVAGSSPAHDLPILCLLKPDTTYCESQSRQSAFGPSRNIGLLSPEAPRYCSRRCITDADAAFNLTLRLRNLGRMI